MANRGWRSVVVGGMMAVGLMGREADAASLRYEEREGGRILVPVSVNGKGPYTFLFDTGADTTVLDARLALKLGLVTAGKAPMRTFAGRLLVPLARVERLSLGSWSGGTVEVACVDLAETFGLSGDIQGILGQDFLARFSFLLVRKERRFEIDEDGRLAEQLGGIRLTVDRKGGRYYVRGQLAGASEPRRLLLDSGIPYSVLYEDPELDLRCSGANTAAQSGIGSRKLRSCRLATLDLGPVQFRNLAVQLTPRLAGQPRWEDGILPLTLFDAIYFNNAENFVILNPSRAR